MAAPVVLAVVLGATGVPAGPAHAGAHAVVAEPAGSGRRIDIELQDADIRDVLELFGEIGRVNIIVDRRVHGRVSCKLRNIPWDDALRAILRSHRLGMIWQDNVIWVAPAEELERRPVS